MAKFVIYYVETVKCYAYIDAESESEATDKYFEIFSSYPEPELMFDKVEKMVSDSQLMMVTKIEE